MLANAARYKNACCCLGLKEEKQIGTRTFLQYKREHMTKCWSEAIDMNLSPELSSTCVSAAAAIKYLSSRP